MDAEYLTSTIGQPLSLAIAEVCIVQPHDPIEWLSGWLYKYVDSARYLKDYGKDKWQKSTLENQQKQQEAMKLDKEQEEVGLQISSCNYIASLRNDPFNLWQQAIKAISSFTDCTAVYIAAVIEPIWEPNPVKGEDKRNNDEGIEEEEEEPLAMAEESDVEESEQEEDTKPYDSDEEERIEEEERKAEEAAEAEAIAIAATEAEEKVAAEARTKQEVEEAESTESEGGEMEDEEDEEEDNKKTEKQNKRKEEKVDQVKDERRRETSTLIEGDPLAKLQRSLDGEPLGNPSTLSPPSKAPRPVKYKKMIAKYMAASPRNIFMLNKELTKKMGPVTWRVLEKGLPSLHITNVLYKQGIYFFGGLPRIGAYFVAPIVLRGTIKYPPRVVALLCVDTLKLETIGTGKPFRESEVFFLQEIARAITHSMNEDYLEAIKDIDTITPVLVERIKDQFKDIKAKRKIAVKKAAIELKEAQKASAKEKRRLEKEEKLEALRKKREEKAAKKDIKNKEKQERRKEREAKRKAKEDVGEEDAEGEEEEEEEIDEEEELEGEVELEEAEELEEEEEESDIDEDNEAESKSLEFKNDAKDSEVGDSEIGSEEEDVTEVEEEEPEEPESDPEDWGEELKQEIEDVEGGDTTDVETNVEAEGETETESVEEKSEGEETQDGEAEGEETDEEVTDAETENSEPSEEMDGEDLEGNLNIMTNLEAEKRKAEKKEKANERRKKVAENKKSAREGLKKVKEKEREVAKWEKVVLKHKETLKELSEQMTKLEISLSKGDLIVKHHQLLVSTIVDHILEFKDCELKRLRCIPYPRRRLFRVLKALLVVMEKKKHVVDDWIGVRLLLNEDFINDIKNFDTSKLQDPMKWRLVESYIVGLTGKRLSKEAPFAYLGLKWLLRVKKLSTACAHYLNIKAKYETQSKAVAAADLAKILGQVNLKVVMEDLKKTKEDEKARLSRVGEEDKKYFEEEAKLKVIEDAEEAVRAAEEEAATGLADAAMRSETEGETEGDETEGEEEED